MNTISSLFKWIGNLVGADPSTLTTTSKTLVGAINEVDAEVDDAKNALAWKLQGTASGTGSTVNMPTDYNEIMLVASYSTTSFFVVVPKNEISSTAIYPRFATYYNTTSNAGGYFTVSSSTASIGNLVQNSGQVVTGATFKLYYR